MRLRDVILRGTRAAQPAANTLDVGTLYYVTDETKTERSNGATWDSVSDSGAPPDGSITTAKLADGAVTTLKLADANVTTVKLLDANVTTAKLADNGVTAAKLRDSAALSVIGNATNAGADPADIAAGTDGNVLRRRGTALEFATIHSTGADGAEPGGPAPSDLYFPNNSFYAERYSGSVWRPWGPIWPLTRPIDGNYAWINQGAAAVDATNGGILLTGPAGAGDNLRIRKKAAPGVPYTITAMLLPIAGKRANATYGIGFRQSSDGKLHLLMLNHYDSGTVYSIKFTNATTFSATYTSSVMNTLDLPMPPKFIRIADDNVNRILSLSVDGYDWLAFHTIGRTDFLTADEVLFFVNAADAAVATKARLLSWTEA